MDSSTYWVIGIPSKPTKARAAGSRGQKKAKRAGTRRDNRSVNLVKKAQQRDRRERQARKEANAAHDMRWNLVIANQRAIDRAVRTLYTLLDTDYPEEE